MVSWYTHPRSAHRNYCTPRSRDPQGAERPSGYRYHQGVALGKFRSEEGKVQESPLTALLEFHPLRWLAWVSVCSCFCGFLRCASPCAGQQHRKVALGVLWLSSIHFYTDIGQTSTSKEGRTIWSISRAGFESGLSTDRFCPSYPDVYVSPLSSVGLFLRADFSLSHRSAFSCSFICLLLFSVKKLDFDVFP